jgi:hypothetical protein
MKTTREILTENRTKVISLINYEIDTRMYDVTLSEVMTDFLNYCESDSELNDLFNQDFCYIKRAIGLFFSESQYPINMNKRSDFIEEQKIKAFKSAKLY